MTRKIVNVSEIEKLCRYSNPLTGEKLIAENDLRALLDKAPSVSDEAAGWQFFAYGKWHTGNDKNNHKQSTLGAGYKIRELYTTPQPDRVAELQAKIDKLMLEYCPNEMTKEQLDNWAKHQALAKIEE